MSNLRTGGGGKFENGHDSPKCFVASDQSSSLMFFLSEAGSMAEEIPSNKQYQKFLKHPIDTITLPETSSSPLKMGRAPKGKKFVFQPSIFRGEK